MQGHDAYVWIFEELKSLVQLGASLVQQSASQERGDFIRFCTLLCSLSTVDYCGAGKHSFDVHFTVLMLSRKAKREVLPREAERKNPVLQIGLRLRQE
eukprot:s4030_g1.t1